MSRMSDLDLAIKDAANTARMQMGKWRMIEKISECAMEIFDEFYPMDADPNLVDEIEEKIWNATI